MKKVLLKLCMLVCFLFSSTCFAGLNDYPNIAIMPFSNHASVSTSADSLSGTPGQIALTDAQIASDYVLDALLDSDRFSIMERDQMEAILKEHHLNLSGLVDPATAVQIGRLTGIKYIVYGSVVGCSLKEKGVSYDNSVIGGVANKQHTVIANVVGRFIDVETGRIVLAARGKGASTSTHNEIQWKRIKKSGSVSGDIGSGVSVSSYDGLGIDSYEDNSSSYNSVTTTETTTEKNHTIKFGTENVSQEQVHNAIAKAADDLVYGKMGFLAKMDGKAKRRRR